MKIEFFKKQTLDWDDFVIENRGSFLQSAGWFKFNKGLALGVRVKREDELVLQALVIKKVFPFLKKHYFYLPYGPVLKKDLNEEERKAAMELFLKALNKAVLVRIEPYSEIIWPTGFNFRKPLTRIQPQKTLVLDLTRSEDDILSDFDKNSRYNVGLAERKGVQVIIKEDYDPELYQLLERVSKRNQFRIFEEDHYKKFFELDDKNLKTRLFLGRYKKKIISAYLVVFFNKKAICLHGSSDLRYKKVKPANLLVWKRAQYAKEQGCELLDLWGIDKNRWPGMTSFKKSFGGNSYTYPKSRDVVFNKFLYQSYIVLKRFL